MEIVDISVENFNEMIHSKEFPLSNITYIKTFMSDYHNVDYTQFPNLEILYVVKDCPDNDLVFIAKSKLNTVVFNNELLLSDGIQ
jgi:hypothetical protein